MEVKMKLQVKKDPKKYVMLFVLIGIFVWLFM